jgi:hypothetical protein
MTKKGVQIACNILSNAVYYATGFCISLQENTNITKAVAAQEKHE